MKWQFSIVLYVERDVDDNTSESEMKELAESIEDDVAEIVSGKIEGLKLVDLPFEIGGEEE